ncbi:MAG: hypothetical protein M3N95_16195 [Actinomycetota bacterium]|nr:hypothetical protein [Actinomycetota bacterium]
MRFGRVGTSVTEIQPSDREGPAAVPSPRRSATVAGGLVLTAWLLITVSNTASIGFLNPRTIPCLVLAAVILVVAATTAGGAPLRLAPGGAAVFALIAGASVLFVPMYTYLPAGDFGWLTVAMAVGAGAFAGATVWTKPRLAWPLWAVGVLIVLGGLVAVVALDPAPRIDVWVILQQSSSGLGHLQNFYAMQWTKSPGWQSLYPYLPVTTLVLAPFRWLIGDVRIGLLACVVVSALLLIRRGWARAHPVPLPPVLPFLLLFAPGSIGLIEQSWSEPVLLVFLVGAFAAVQRGRIAMAVVCLALALATKQHAVTLIPLMAAWPRIGLRRTAVAVAGAIGICLPWLLANPHDFIEGAVVKHLTAPARGDAPTLYTLATQHGWSPPSILPLGLLVLAVAFACWSVRRIPRTGHACLLAALLLFTAALLNKQSFYNQYWLPAGLLIAALCLDAQQSEQVLPASQSCQSGDIASNHSRPGSGSRP